MTDAISGFRNDYANMLNGTTNETTVYNAVFTDEEQSVSVDDFLSLMVAQLTNQDFMNPVDDTQFVTQLAQFATMQQMQEMAAYMKTNYVMGLIGQNVTVARFTVGGSVERETGSIEKISLVNNEYTLTVNGKTFSLEQIMEIHKATEAESSDKTAETEATGDGDTTE